MIKIKCPFCGERGYTEFQYGGDATVKAPPLDDKSNESWVEFVYLRDNPRGEHLEYWQHTQGCRSWLRVRRNTLTHAITAVEPARCVSRPSVSGEGQ